MSAFCSLGTVWWEELMCCSSTCLQLVERSDSLSTWRRVSFLLNIRRSDPRAHVQNQVCQLRMTFSIEFSHPERPPRSQSLPIVHSPFIRHVSLLGYVLCGLRSRFLWTPLFRCARGRINLLSQRQKGLVMSLDVRCLNYDHI